MSSELISGLLRRGNSYTFTHDFELQPVDQPTPTGSKTFQPVFYPKQSSEDEEKLSENSFIRRNFNVLPKFGSRIFQHPTMVSQFYKIKRVLTQSKAAKSRKVSATDPRMRRSRSTASCTYDHMQRRLWQKLGFGSCEILEFRQAFSIFDKDKDGTINSKELGVIIRSLGQNPTETELWKMICDYDKDGDGTIDFQEFVLMMAQLQQKQDWDKEIRESYRVFDREKKGFIHVGDLRYTLTNLGKDTIGDEEIEQLLAYLDRDGDKQISYEQFANFLSLMICR